MEAKYWSIVETTQESDNPIDIDLSSYLLFWLFAICVRNANYNLSLKNVVCEPIK